MDQTATDTSARRRSKRRRALFAILLGASFATLGAGAMSLAIFTDSDASNGSWTSGTIILNVTPATSFNVTNILPGDSGNQTLNVSNTGTGALRYAMTTSATNADGNGLAAQMDLVIQAGTCAAPGATLYNGPLDAAEFGDPGQGDDAGDRAVASGAADSLCFSWDFPLNSGNSFQNSATTATFTFDAEQTANNP
ncbi:MAG TPA: TasA family protein [Candidatus Limnocylindrales bacterium]